MNPQSAFQRVYYWLAERLYHEAVWAYDLAAWLVSLGRWADWRRQVLDFAVGERLLELGFGTGHLLVEAAARGFEVWGADPSREMQRVAGRRIRAHRSDARRALARAQALPFADRTFDTIIATFPTSYIVHPATFHEVRRLLRGDDGRFVVTGVGFRTDNAFVRSLMRRLFGGGYSDEGTELYRDMAAAHGFTATVIEDRSKVTRVLVFVLQPTRV
jgi:ubiquinone/menaquinone biosynthesis C-methylase UbiE